METGRRKTDQSVPVEKVKKTFLERLGSIHAWTAGNRWRGVLVGAGIIALVASTVGTWLFLASLTVTHDIPTLEETLAAYDRGEVEDARLMVVRMTSRGNLKLDDYGGPLFVLGAVKTVEAEAQWSVQHKRSAYLLAARYLREAQVAGFPPGRETEGTILLGRALIESGDVEAGAQVLEEVLVVSPESATELHLILARAYLLASDPNLRKALHHIDLALSDQALSDQQRVEAMLNRIDMLTGLERFQEARETLASVPEVDDYRAQVLLTSARLDLAEARRKVASRLQTGEISDDLRAEILAIVEKLEAFPGGDETAEQALYLTGQAHVLVGDTKSAIEQFEHIRRRFSSSPVGIAASIAEGELLREREDYVDALTPYRRALTALEDPRTYQNRLLPLGELRQRILAAHADFLAKDQHEVALKLIELSSPILSRNRQLELRAATLSDWGHDLLIQSRQENWNRLQLARDGREQLRKAGVVFEELAGRRFATVHYPDDVWESAECYFLGQSYTSCIRMLDEYLKNEPVKRNAQALLRLGQSHLARGNLTAGIEALEECVELHPYDSAIYQARLAAAKAYRERDDMRRAESLLLANLHDSGQSPESAEWRDSLFEIGRILHDAGRFSEAIDRFDEAVARESRQRFPDLEQIRMALYLTGISHRHAAEAPLAELTDAKTVNERERASALARRHLVASQKALERVRRDINQDGEMTPLDRAMLRNCYMFEGAVLFDLGRVENSPERFSEAIAAYSNVSTLYHEQPFVLEPLVQIANCQRRLKQNMEARLRIAYALEFLERMPPDADFETTTNFTRNEWKMLLTQMLTW